MPTPTSRTRPPGQIPTRARVWRLSFVPGARTRRVDADPVGEALLLQTVFHDTFTQRRTTDVAQADEKNGNIVVRCHATATPSTCRVMPFMCAHRSLSDHPSKKRREPRNLKSTCVPTTTGNITLPYKS